MAGDCTFDGRVAVVTGAGRGLGRAHALLLAERGAKVVVNDLGRGLDGTGEAGEEAAAVAAEIRAGGGEAIANADSVANEQAADAIIGAAIEAFGRVDIIVNNAGILRDKAFHNMTTEQFGSVVETHLMGSYFVTRAAWGQMRSQGYGRIVMTTSAAGLLGNFGQANYAAAKLGIVGLAKVLGIEGDKHGIRVNAIAPIAATRMTDGLLGRLADGMGPELVAPAVAVLASEACPTTGEVYSVGGGRIAQYVFARTQGFQSPTLSPEEILERWEDVTAQGDLMVPRAPADEMRQIAAAW